MIIPTTKSLKNLLMGLLFLATLCISSSSASNIDCTHVSEVEKESLPWTLPELAAPWSVHHETRVYKSQTITDKINEALMMHLPGTNNNFKDAIIALQNIGCLVYIHGGLIRDAFLGDQLKDIDIEYSNCDLVRINEACVETFGADNCRVVRDNYLVIGKLHKSVKNQTGYPLDVVSSEVSLYAKLCSREFTTNSIAYDLVNEVLIDSTGTGVTDTCAKEINLPVPEGEWVGWLNECDIIPDKGNKKLPRYWKMRGKNYTASSNVADFMTNTLKGNFTTHIKYFRKVFCDLVPEAKADVNGTGCVLTVQLDEHSLMKVRNYENALKADMGEEWYAENIVANKINRFYMFAEAHHTARYGSHDHAAKPLWVLITGASLIVLLIAFLWVRESRKEEPKVVEDNEQMMQYAEEYLPSPARRRGVSSPTNVNH